MRASSATTRSCSSFPTSARAFENVGDREFTFHLRPGHRWSDGAPFTADDFRYYWEDVANNKALSPLGLPMALLVNGKGPRVTFPDPLTIRYAWDDPNPLFLPALAGPSPLFLYRPAHYLRQFHAKYIGEEKAKAQAAAVKMRNWAGLHHKKDEQYRFDNPELPTLEPWINTTPLPTTRFVLVRNPYFHRVDPDGRQLPYIDRVVIALADEKLVPAKTGAGEVDLQARYLRFDDYTFLKRNEKRSSYKVRLWETVKGSQIALYPNLNAADPAWRKLLRDVRFRRALSLAINRHELNEVVYFGLVQPSNNTVLPQSPLFDKTYRSAWTKFDLKAANALLDEIGLTARDARGLRLMPDGQALEIVVDTAGESTEETDVLELIRDSWRKVGIALYTRPSQREVFRKRVFSGQVDHVGVVRPEQRHPDRRHEPRGAGADEAGAAAVADVGQSRREQRQGRRSAHAARGDRASRAVPRVAALAGQRRARAHLAADARDPRRAAIHDRHGHREPAAGRRARRASQRADQGTLQLGSRRVLRDLPARHVLDR